MGAAPEVGAEVVVEAVPESEPEPETEFAAEVEIEAEGEAETETETEVEVEADEAETVAAAVTTDARRSRIVSIDVDQTVPSKAGVSGERLRRIFKVFRSASV